jgi:hypothetical protein
VEVLSGEAVTTPELCKAACEDLIGDTTTNDNCCYSIDMQDVGLSCILLGIDAAELDIREEAADEEGVTYEAWAW